MNTDRQNRLVASGVVVLVVGILWGVTSSESVMEKLLTDDVFRGLTPETEKETDLAEQNEVVTLPVIKTSPPPVEAADESESVLEPVMTTEPQLQSGVTDATRMVGGGVEAELLPPVVELPDSVVEEQPTEEMTNAEEPVNHQAEEAQAGEELPVIDLELGEGDEALWWLSAAGKAYVTVSTQVDGEAALLKLTRSEGGTVEVHIPVPEERQRINSTRYLQLDKGRLPWRVRHEAKRGARQRLSGVSNGVFEFKLHWSPEMDASLMAWQREELTRIEGIPISRVKSRVWVENAGEGLAVRKEVLVE